MSYSISRRRILSLGVIVGAGTTLGLGKSIFSPPASAQAAVASRAASGDPAPPAEITDKLNKIRKKLGLATTAWSNIYAIQSPDKTPNGDAQTVAQWATAELSNFYWNQKGKLWSQENPSTNYGFQDPLKNTDKSKNVIDNITNTVACAYRSINYSLNGIQANANYSTSKTISGIDGGRNNFPIYPTDMQSIINGPNIPGLKTTGMEMASADLRKYLSYDPISFDFNNAVISNLEQRGLIEDLVFDTTIYSLRLTNNLTASTYLEYLVEASKDSPEMLAGARYWQSKEIASLNAIDPIKAKSVHADLQINYMTNKFKDISLAKTPVASIGIDYVVLPWVLEKMEDSLASKGNSTLRSTFSLVTGVRALLAKDSSDVAGLAQNKAVRDVFMVLTGYEWYGKSGGSFFSDTDIENAISSSGDFFKNNISIKQKFFNLLSAANSSGVLGTVSSILSIFALVIDSINLNDAIENGKVTAPQAASFVARVFGVYSSLGSMRNLLITIASKVPKVQLEAVSEALALPSVVPSVFKKNTGAIWNPPSAVTASDEAAIELQTFADNSAKEFAQNLQIQETSFIETLYTDWVETLVKSSTSGSEELTRRIAAEQLDESIECLTDLASLEKTAIPSEAIKIAQKSFNLSLGFAGLLSAAIFFGSDIYGIATGDGVSASAVLYVVSDSLSLVGSIISVQALVVSSVSASLTMVGIGIGLASAVIGLFAGVVKLIENEQSLDKLREQVRSDFERIESATYLHDWGIKLAFLSCYYSVFAKGAAGSPPVTRWSPENVSIFIDEAAAWDIFLRTSGTDAQRMLRAADSLKSVPSDIVEQGKVLL